LRFAGALARRLQDPRAGLPRQRASEPPPSGSRRGLDPKRSCRAERTSRRKKIDEHDHLWLMDIVTTEVCDVSTNDGTPFAAKSSAASTRARRLGATSSSITCFLKVEHGDPLLHALGRVRGGSTRDPTVVAHPPRVVSNDWRRVLPDDGRDIERWLDGRLIAERGGALFWFVPTPFGAFRQHARLTESDGAVWRALPKWFRDERSPRI
jgi:hypothetical protein